MTHTCSVCSIVPPHILKKMLESNDEAARSAALETLLTTTRLRAERTLIGQLGFIHSSGGARQRTIFDCRMQRQLDDAVRLRGERDKPNHDVSCNQAFDGLGETYDFYQQVLERNSIDGRNMRLDGYVHFGRSYNNAFWDGRHMVFGDGDGRLFVDFAQSLDVIAHELTHGVTETTAGLEYHDQPGALNESISDVFGSLVKQWKKKQDAAEADWLIGAEIFTPKVKGDALRSLKAPGTAYDDPLIGRDPQPAHMDDFAKLPNTEEGDFGGVHINSGIPNHAFYRVATGIGGQAWEAPGHIWYEALKASGPLTDFAGFAALARDAAGRLYGSGSREQQIVLDAWDAVGVRVPSIVAGRGRDSGRARGTKEADSLTALQWQIDGLMREVKALSSDVALLKSQGSSRAA